MRFTTVDFINASRTRVRVSDCHYSRMIPVHGQSRVINRGCGGSKSPTDLRVILCYTRIHFCPRRFTPKNVGLVDLLLTIIDAGNAFVYTYHWNIAILRYILILEKIPCRVLVVLFCFLKPARIAVRYTYSGVIDHVACILNPVKTVLQR